MIGRPGDQEPATPRIGDPIETRKATKHRPRRSVDGRLGRSFFNRDPDVVARDLVGATLVVHDHDRTTRALIVETEAYGGDDDPASHAHRGPTQRCAVMFGPAGHLYVYRIYGLHWCANVVTGAVGTASAVLLRAAEIVDPVVNEDAGNGPRTLLRGPGNLTRGLGLTGADNGIDCCRRPAGRITFHDGADWGEPRAVNQSSRIGLSREKDRQSRYFLEGHRAVSKTPNRLTGAENDSRRPPRVLRDR